MQPLVKQSLLINDIVNDALRKPEVLSGNLKEIFTFLHEESTDYFLDEILKNNVQQDINVMARNHKMDGNEVNLHIKSPVILTIDDIEDFKPDNYKDDPKLMNFIVVERFKDFFTASIKEKLRHFIYWKSLKKKEFPKYYIEFADYIEREVINIVQSLNRNEKVMANFSYIAINISDAIERERQTKALSEALSQKSEPAGERPEYPPIIKGRILH